MNISVVMASGGVLINKLQTRAFLCFCIVLTLLPCHMAKAEVFRDPTRPPNVRPAAPDKETGITPSGLQLQAIIISENRRSAIIGNRSVHMGDSIGGAKLISINESEVVLKTGEKLQILNLFPISSKRQPSSDRAVTR